MDQTTRTPGRTERRRAFGGILIVAALVALAILIISLDELLASRTETVDLYAELPQTEGLQSGAPVWIAGSEVGTVLAVSLRPPGDEGEARIVALARIPLEHLQLLRSDTRASVTTPGLVGDPVLDLSPGTAGAPRLSAGDTVPAEHAPDRIARALGDARAVLVDVDTLLGQLRHVAALYRERRPMIEQASRSLELASAELDRSAQRFGASPLAAAMGDAQLAARFDRVRASLATLQQGLGRYTSGPLGARIDALAVRADSLQADLAVLDSLASDTRGFVGRARADSALQVEGARTSAQLDSLIREVTSNPFMFF